MLTLAAGAAAYGTTHIATVQGVDALRLVCLVRHGSTTHLSNNEQRLVDVPFVLSVGGGLRLELTGDPGLAPPGWYLVFAVSTAGVRSEGVWLQRTA